MQNLRMQEDANGTNFTALSILTCGSPDDREVVEKAAERYGKSHDESSVYTGSKRFDLLLLLRMLNLHARLQIEVCINLVLSSVVNPFLGR